TRSGFPVQGVDEAPDGRDPIRRDPDLLRVLADRLFVRTEVDAVDLVSGHVAVEPLDLGAHPSQDLDGLPGHRLELGVRELACSRDLALDHEFGHGRPPRLTRSSTASTLTAASARP